MLTRVLGSSAVCLWSAAALAQQAQAEVEPAGVELPLAPVVAVLVGVLVFVALRLRAWLRLEVEPALHALREAAAGLRRRTEPPVLRRMVSHRAGPPLVLGSEWIRGSEVSVVGGGGAELALAVAAELLSATGGTVVLGLTRPDEEVFSYLEGRGLSREAVGARLLRVDAAAAARDPGGLLAQAAAQPSPLYVVLGLDGSGHPSTFVPWARDVAARAEPEVRRAAASLIIVLLDAAPGAVRVLAGAPGVSEGRWLSGEGLVFPTDESAAARADLG